MKKKKHLNKFEFVELFNMLNQPRRDARPRASATKYHSKLTDRQGCLSLRDEFDKSQFI
jgi:hypothetical protein